MSKIIPDLKVFLLLIFSTVILFILDIINVLNLPKQLAFYITNPISFGIYSTYRDIGKQFYFVFSARYAAQENKALREQLGQFVSENADLRKKLAEADAMLTQQDHLDPQTYNLVPARPIGLGRYLKIDKGSTANIKVNQAVVFKDNYIGKIISVSPQSSNIQLLADPDSKVAAFSQNNEGKAKGVLLGQFGTELLLDKILHEEKIGIGDLVYSEGIEGFIPRGLILGRVTQVLKRENEVFQQAKLQQVFGVGDLELVFVIQD